MSDRKDPESIVREIKRKTRRKYSSEEKIRIVLEGLRGEQTIAELCHREGISPNLYYNWSKEFLEAGKRRLIPDIPTPPFGLVSSNRISNEQGVYCVALNSRNDGQAPARPLTSPDLLHAAGHQTPGGK